MSTKSHSAPPVDYWTRLNSSGGSLDEAASQMKAAHWKARMRRTRIAVVTCACMVLQAPALTLAADPLGLYIGGALGRSTIRNDQIVFTSPFVTPQVYDLDEHHAAWKVMLGLRPVPMLGGEFEYLDFGHPSVNSTFVDLPLEADARVKGPALFAVGYLPIPIPLLDIYGKVGLADLRDTVNATNVGHYTCGAACPGIVWIPGVYHLNRTSWDGAYGAGAQLKLSSLAVRVEYERVIESGGDPDLLSMGLTWSF